MRRLAFFFSAGILIFAAAALVEGLQAQQKGGGGFGGGGGGGTTNPLSLLARGEVKKELDLTDEQYAKVTPEVMAALAKVLNEKQLTRLKQIQVQQMGNNAFKDDAIAKQLKLTDAQKTSINEVLEASAKESAELAKAAFGKGKGGGFGGNQEKATKIRTEAREKIVGTLTKAQKRTWTEMTGEEFKLTPAGGVGGFFNKGKTDPKKDAPKDK